MPTIQYNTHKVDTISLVVLEHLRDAAQPVETPELVAQFPDGEENKHAVERGETIRYRMREYLVPAGLVEYGEHQHKNGGTYSAKTYLLTDAGREFLAENAGVVDDAVKAVKHSSRVEVREEILTDLHTTIEVMDELQESVSDVSSDVDRHQERLDNHNGRVRSLEETRPAKEFVQRRFEAVEAQVEELDAKLGAVPSDGDGGWITVEEQLSEAKGGVAEHTGDLGEHRRRILALKKVLEQLENRVEELEPDEDEDESGGLAQKFSF